MTEIPRRALSVRQPWAWAIFHGKDVENRSQGFFGKTKHSYFEGPVAIHASKGMTQDEYREAAEDIERITGAPPPRPDLLVRGAIIGHVRVTAVTRKTSSPWYAGMPYWVLVLADPVEVEPIPCDGALGYFEWKWADRDLEKPLRWMRGWRPGWLPGGPDAPVEQMPPSPQSNLWESADD